MTNKLPLDRRRFLQLAGSTMALTALSSSVARAAQIAPAVRTRTIGDIEHIVVLMQENRAFDHYFGSLRGVRGFGDPHPVIQPSGQPVWNQSGVLPFRPALPAGASDLGLVFIQDLAHGWQDTHQAWNNGNWDRWVPAKTSPTMAYLTRDDIPFHYALADAFTICDNYFCSTLTSTNPNRYYMWAGWTGNDGRGGGPVLNNAEKGYSWTTYPERLEAAGVSWKIYQDIGKGLDAAGVWGFTSDAFIGNFGDNSLLYFSQYQTATAGNPLFDKARTGTNVARSGGFFDILAADVASGALPQVSWIVAPEAFSEHPNWPANFGAWYVSQVLDTLTASPGVWSKTALIICYDENDGFFDHLVPPFPASGPAAGGSTVSTDLEFFPGATGFVAGPYGLGPRVPMLVISPWSRGGWVCSEVFDATSVIRFIERRFGVPEPHISAWRRSVCGDLTSAFDFGQRSSSVPALPSTAGFVPADHLRHSSFKPVPPPAGTMPVQEAGTRPARALPYDLRADGKVASGNLTVTFASRGQAGAVFHVTSAGRPQTFTAGAGASLTGTWPLNAGQDVRVHGPNGFFRQFTGAGPDVTAAPAGQNLGLVFTNRSNAPAELTVAEAYSGKSLTVAIRGGGFTPVVIQTGAGQGWYDITVTSHHDSSYLRRLAGHVETGAPSISDPALGTASQDYGICGAGAGRRGRHPHQRAVTLSSESARGG
ncbi:MAG TPA: phospholipase C, phosphocholine-specific [Streptosporangiaceae bacterium]